MKRFLLSTALAAVLVIPCVVRSQTIPSTVGAGPNGYDWQIGTWSCSNSMPSAAGGPSSQTLTVTRTSGGAILYHTAAERFDVTSYNVYVPAKKMWLSPFIVADGTYGSEATTDSGKTIVWTGTQVDPAGKTSQVRDTLVYDGTKYSDLGETRLADTWKVQYKITCTKC